MGRYGGRRARRAPFLYLAFGEAGLRARAGDGSRVDFRGRPVAALVDWRGFWRDYVRTGCLDGLRLCGWGFLRRGADGRPEVVGFPSALDAQYYRIWARSSGRIREAPAWLRLAVRMRAGGSRTIVDRVFRRDRI